MANQECSICLNDFNEDTYTLPFCGHKFHRDCIMTLYQETYNHCDPETGRKLRPSCPLCRHRISSKDLPQGKFKNPVAAARRRRQLELLREEPAYAQIPEYQRPLRLTRELVVLEREEREALINGLVARRAEILRNQAKAAEDRARKLQASVGEAEPGCSSNIGDSFQSVILEDIQNLPAQVENQGINSSTEETPPKLHPSTEVIDIQIQLSVARIQASQLGEEGCDLLSLEEQNCPAEFSSGPDDDLKPVQILDTWARGRHMRYKVKWSDGSITLNKTQEIESSAMPLLIIYRREKRRLATALTRERQRQGIVSKITGRGRGRGRKS